MKTVQVICDGCGADLTTRSNSVDYRLVLTSEDKPGRGFGAYTDMMIYPPLERAHHFCGLTCLDHWRDHERFYAKLWQEFWDKWKSENGTVHYGGMISYPDIPKEERKSRQDEFRAAALAEFPLRRDAK